MTVLVDGADGDDVFVASWINGATGTTTAAIAARRAVACGHDDEQACRVGRVDAVVGDVGVVAVVARAQHDHTSRRGEVAVGNRWNIQ